MRRERVDNIGCKQRDRGILLTYDLPICFASPISLTSRYAVIEQLLPPPRLREPDTRSALIYITGAKWSPKYESPNPEGLPRSAPLFARIAEVMRTPIVILRHVPQQPLFAPVGGKRRTRPGGSAAVAC